ncbi:nucleoside hydrolase [Kiloniella laminariae]|uniref:Nucleoside hydrolase n=1 Tax=Kiloniella laminariae TaxID=454162 RepID=A0ABT4LGI0_9PROT|nr:nucleoside hydrolase [Kiloniella laminariae]MCZ4280198.1 nucleoside hydrolase [Kiloniella laminariae]
MKNPVIFDTDPGIDDAFSIHHALYHPEINLIGLTTVFGNVPVEIAAKNARILVEMAGQDIPVFKGAAGPLVAKHKGFPDFIHGADGFGDINLPDPKGSIEKTFAPQFIIDSVRKQPGEVTIIAVGPLTNLAMALRMDPGIAPLVKEVIIMGGTAKEYGNMSAVAEANIFNDPHAADIVFRADWPMVMAGLDVTHQVMLLRKDAEALAKTTPRIGGFLLNAADLYFRFYQGIFGIDGCYFHDPCATAYYVNPELFGTVAASVRVSCEGPAFGQTIIKPAGHPSPSTEWDGCRLHKICMQVDEKRVKEEVLGTIARYAD